MQFVKSKRDAWENQFVENLLNAQSRMAQQEQVDAKGLVILSRFLWKLIHQLPDELIEVYRIIQTHKGAL